MLAHAPIHKPLEYRDRDGEPAICETEVISLQDDRTVVIAMESLQNPDKDISASTEYAATAACKEFGIKPEQLVWIERYRRRDKEEVQSDVFYLVSFGNFRPDRGLVCNCPSGRRMDPHDWDSLSLPVRVNR